MSAENADVVQKLDDVYSQPTPLATSAYYDQWASSYDQDLGATFFGPKRLVEFVMKQIPQDFSQSSRILDIGAGTGKVAELLREHGFTNIDALDGSEAMLSKARARSLYQNYFCEILSETEPSASLSPNTYDLVLAVGVFNAAHLNRKHLLHFISAAKPGAGHIMFGLSNNSKISSVFHKEILVAVEGKLNLVVKESVDCYGVTTPGTDPGGVFYHFVKK